MAKKKKFRAFRWCYVRKLLNGREQVLVHTLGDTRERAMGRFFNDKHFWPNGISKEDAKTEGYRLKRIKIEWQ